MRDKMTESSKNSLFYINGFTSIVTILAFIFFCVALFKPLDGVWAYHDIAVAIAIILGITTVILWGVRLAALIVRIISKIKCWRTISMISLSLVTYFFVFCIVHGYRSDDVSYTLFSSLIWFAWAIVMLMLRFSGKNQKQVAKVRKIFSLISFSSVPLIAFVLIVLLRCRDSELFTLIMLILAPLGFFISWFAYWLYNKIQNNGD